MYLTRIAGIETRALIDTTCNYMMYLTRIAGIETPETAYPDAEHDQGVSYPHSGN